MSEEKMRRPYVKPRLRVIELETGEVMQGSCKTMQGKRQSGLRTVVSCMVSSA